MSIPQEITGYEFRQQAESFGLRKPMPGMAMVWVCRDTMLNQHGESVPCNATYHVGAYVATDEPAYDITMLRRRRDEQGEMDERDVRSFRTPPHNYSGMGILEDIYWELIGVPSMHGKMLPPTAEWRFVSP